MSSYLQTLKVHFYNEEDTLYTRWPSGRPTFWCDTSDTFLISSRGEAPAARVRVLCRAVVSRGGGGRVVVVVANVVVGKIVVVAVVVVVVVVDAELGILSDSIAWGSSRRGSESEKMKVW